MKLSLKKEKVKTEKAVKEKPKKKAKKQSKPLFAKKEEAPKQPQYYRSKTNIQTLNYKVYYMSAKEKLLYSILAFAAGGFAGYVFFGGLFKDEFGDPTFMTKVSDIAFIVIAGLIAAKLFLPIRTKQLLENRQRDLRVQFRDMLEALTTSLNAGRNVTDSFAAAYEDLGNQYESDAYILNELDVINSGLRNGITIEEMLVDFGARSGVDDIADFANVFEICFQKGGNIKDTVRNTYDIINDKTAVLEEIHTTVAGTRLELVIMLVLPVGMIMMMKGMSPDFANNFSTPTGFVSELIAIVLFVAAYFIGTKIMDFKV